MTTTVPDRIALIGGSGRLGRLVAARLAEDGTWPLRLLTRAPDAARAALGDRAEVVAGDIGDDAALAALLDGASRLFLLTPIAADLAVLQTRAINAAARAGVSRIVKLSGSDWTITNRHRSRAGEQHALVEERLVEAPVASVAIRPNAWMQTGLAAQIAAWKAGGEGPPPERDAPVASIDIRDIAEAAAISLISDKHFGRTYNLNGPAILSGPRVASIWSKALGKEIKYAGENLDSFEEQMRKHAPSWAAFDIRMMFQRYLERGFVAEDGDAATLTKLLGHEPRTYEDFAREAATEWQKAANSRAAA